MQFSKTGKTLSLGVVSRGWSQITGMLLALLAARILGKHGYGIYSISSIFVIILQVLMYTGVYDYIIKTRDTEIDVDACFWMNLGFGAAGACLIAALAPLMGAAMHSATMVALMLALAPSVPLASVSSWQEALLLRQGRLNTFYRVIVATETLACLTGVASLLSGAGVWSFVIYRYAQLIFSGAAYLGVMRLLPKFRWDSATARAAMTFAGNLYLGTITALVSGYGVDLLIGLWVNPAAAGAYRLATRMVLGVSEVAYQPVSTIAWVHFSKAGRDNATLGKEWGSLVVALTVTVWPALAGLALLSKSVIQLLVGSHWDEAAPLLTIIAIGRIACLFQVLMGPMLGSRGRTGDVLKFNLAGAVASLALLVVLVHFGAVGAAVAQAVVWVLLGISGIVVAMNLAHLRLSEVVRILTPGVLATLATVAGASVVAFNPMLALSSLPHIALTTAAGAAGWAVALLLIFRLKVFLGRPVSLFG